MAEECRPAVANCEAADEIDKKRRALLEQADSLGVATQCIALKPPPPPVRCEPIFTPIYQCINYEAVSCDAIRQQVFEGVIYSRIGTPNSLEAETVLSKLEAGVAALTFPSGMAAISNTLICFLKPGDHLITQAFKYGGTTSFLNTMLPSWNVEITEVCAPLNGDISAAFRAATKPNTKMYLAETPCNPTTGLIDLEKLGKLGEETGILTVVDSTFASPINQQPLKYGIDVVIHSGSKYLSGHSDILAGCVVFRKLEDFTKLEMHRFNFSTPLDAACCVLLLRSIRTLKIRVKQHNENAMAVAEFLEGHPKVKRVLYPGLKSHPQHELAKKQMKEGYGGVVSLIVKDQLSARTLSHSLRLFKLAASIGAVESLVIPSFVAYHPGVTAVTSEEAIEHGLEPGLVRLSIGIEDVTDIIDDLTQALNKL